MSVYIHREFFPDGSLVMVDPNNGWDLTLPGGVHVRGSAACLDSALEAVRAAHGRYVVTQWAKGQGTRGGHWLVPLDPRRDR
jgi:hypothetical protein